VSADDIFIQRKTQGRSRKELTECLR
jgi:hypothetical protein